MKKDEEVMEFSPRDEDIRILPDVNVLKIGGQSIMDRGRAAVYPLLDEIIKNKDKHRMIIGVGGGTRSRHAYSIAMDLDMPTGVIAKLGSSISRQNARMLHMLLSRYGGVFIPKENFDIITLYINTGCIPIVCGMPPYEYWERPSSEGRIPECRTDVGVFLIAEFLGARSMIFIKDEDGLYTDDPKKDPSAKLITEISVSELERLNLKDLIIERKVLELMKKAKHMRKVQIINGLKRGTLTAALKGEKAGTVIYV